MAVNFNQKTIFNLKAINTNDVKQEVKGLLVDDEAIIGAFKTIRDQLIFTDKRIISIDVQGVTGKKKSYTTMPYSKIQFFTVQTPGFAEIIPDSELFLTFSNGFVAKFEFSGNTDIGEIARTISKYVL